MRYKTTHTTTYEYSEMVAVCQNEARLTPRNTPTQTCEHHRLVIQPTPSTSCRQTDYFGNYVNYFSINVRHKKLRVTAINRVEVHAPNWPLFSATPPWEEIRDDLTVDKTRDGLDAYQFVFDSPLIKREPVFAEYARAVFTPGKPILEAVVEFTARIHEDFQYDPEATTISTPLQEVFQTKRGVCQDLAHIQIACLRSIGLAARYVSGYIRTMPSDGKPKLLGADASHAWVSVYCGPHGWIDADPTNDILASTDHITVAYGRDYGDVTPLNGLFVGGGSTLMNVSVSVVPVESERASGAVGPATEMDEDAVESTVEAAGTQE